MSSARELRQFSQDPVSESRQIGATVGGTKLCFSPTLLACGWKENRGKSDVNQRHYRYRNCDTELYEVLPLGNNIRSMDSLCASLSACPPDLSDPIAFYFQRAWNAQIRPYYFAFLNPVLHFGADLGV